MHDNYPAITIYFPQTAEEEIRQTKNCLTHLGQDVPIFMPIFIYDTHLQYIKYNV